MTAPTGRSPRRRGRPVGGAQIGAMGSRDRILISARREFAEHGYDKTSIRAIARGADVDPALVHHYFGAKEQMFGAAVEDAAGPLVRGLSHLALEGGADQLGAQLTRYFIGVWEDSNTRGPLLAVLRSALSNEIAAAAFRGFLIEHLTTRVASELDFPDSSLRAQLAAAQLVGAAVLRYVLKVEPLAGLDAEDTIRRLTPAVQHHLTGPLGTGQDLA